MGVHAKPVSPANKRSDQFKNVGPVERRSHRDDASDEREAIEHIVDAIDTVRFKIENEGLKNSEVAEAIQHTVRCVLTLSAHLEDGKERADVFNVVASSAEGASMQQAMNILREAEARFEDAMRDDPPQSNEEYSKIDPETVASDQIAVEHNVTKYRANKLLLNAILVHRCTHVWNAMMRGEITAEIATRIGNELKHVTDPMLRAEIEARILDIAVKKGRCARWSAGMTKRLHHIIHNVDPDALRSDDKEAQRGRRVSTWSPNSAETVVEANLPTVDAEAVWSAVDGLAAQWSQIDGEERTVSQRRADALVQMVTGIDKRPIGDTTPVGAHCCTPHVTLLADLGSERARDRAFTSNGATVRQRLDELLGAARKATLTVVPFAAEDDSNDLPQLCAGLSRLVEQIAEETTYAPSAALRRLVVARDGTCRFPGCNVSAHKCDLDHVKPFNHDHPLLGGLTREDNLNVLCRRHHRDKTHGTSTYRLEADGTVSVDLGHGTSGTSEPNGLRGVGRQARNFEYSTPGEGRASQLREIVTAASALLELLQNHGMQSSPSRASWSVPGDGVSDAGGARPGDFKPRETRAQRRSRATRAFRATAPHRDHARVLGVNALDSQRLAGYIEEPPY